MVVGDDKPDLVLASRARGLRSGGDADLLGLATRDSQSRFWPHDQPVDLFALAIYANQQRPEDDLADLVRGSQVLDGE
jgi:hypothetical protein